jgi:hypothetical protein
MQVHTLTMLVAWLHACMNFNREVAVRSVPECVLLLSVRQLRQFMSSKNVADLKHVCWLKKCVVTNNRSYAVNDMGSYSDMTLCYFWHSFLTVSSFFCEHPTVGGKVFSSHHFLSLT